MDKAKETAEVEFTVDEDRPASPADPPPAERRNWIEILVDPQTLHGLMLCGGGLLVLGLVVWLWSIGLFDNQSVVASCLGTANFALLALGLHFLRTLKLEKHAENSGCIFRLAPRKRRVAIKTIYIGDPRGLVPRGESGCELPPTAPQAGARRRR